MKNRKFKLIARIGRPGDDTQFRIEIYSPGLWSDEDEIRIRREYKGKVSRYGPSIPKSLYKDFITNFIGAEEALEVLKYVV